MTDNLDDYPTILLDTFFATFHNTISNGNGVAALKLRELFLCRSKGFFRYFN